MNTEQLAIGQNLSKQIENLIIQKNTWETCNKINTLELRSAKNNDYRANIDHVNFDLLKTLTLDTINKKIAELQEQFDAL